VNEPLDDKKRLIQKMNELEAFVETRDQRLPPIVTTDEHPAFVAIACYTQEEGLLISVSGDVVEKVFGPPSDPEDVLCMLKVFPKCMRNRASHTLQAS